MVTDNLSKKWSEYITAGSEGCSAQSLDGRKRDLLLSEGCSLGLTDWKLMFQQLSTENTRQSEQKNGQQI